MMAIVLNYRERCRVHTRATNLTHRQDLTGVTFIVWTRSARTGNLRSLNDEEWKAKAETIRAAKADRARRLAGYEEVVAKFEAYLFERDPAGINFEFNSDEYRPESETIALRFLDDGPIDDPGRVVYEEFSRWFGDEDTCGPPSRYEPIGRDLWRIWIDFDA